MPRNSTLSRPGSFNELYDPDRFPADFDGIIAGAPALFVALNICEREEDRKVSLREFLAWSVPFTLVAAVVCYAIGMFVWVLPYVK